MPCFGSRVYVCLHPHPFRSSISKIITLHTALHAIIIAWVLLRWGTSPPGPLTICEWQIQSQGCTDSSTSLLLCSRGRKQRMKDSENKGKGLTAEGRLKDACVCGGDVTTWTWLVCADGWFDCWGIVVIFSYVIYVLFKWLFSKYHFIQFSIFAVLNIFFFFSFWIFDLILAEYLSHSFLYNHFQNFDTFILGMFTIVNH